MATKSPIRIPQETDQWATLKPPNSYRPSSAEMAIKGLGLFLKENKLQSHENDLLPTRSESAPPSMEGSMAAIQNIFSQKVSVSSLRDYSDAKLDKKFKYVDGSRKILPAHEEESEDDQLSENSVSASVEKAASCSNSLESSQVLLFDGSKDSFVEPSPHERDLNTATSTIKQLGVSHSESSSHRAEGSHSRDNYSAAKTHPYGSSTRPFQYGPSNDSGQETQPGFKAPIFITTAAYVAPSSQYYPTMQQNGYYFHPQYNAPYNFNSASFSSYFGGYSQQVPMAFNDASGLYTYDPQNMKFYGQIGMQMPPNLSMQQYLQPSSLHNVYGLFDREPRKGGELVGLGIEHKPRSLSDFGHNSLNPVGGTSPVRYPFVGPGFSDNSTQFPAPSTVSPLKQGKHEMGANYSGERYYVGVSHSLLEELKSGKGQRFKLSDVAGRVCEFSIDQHGSRFIQQQLETCSDEEKARVFDEVVPHASKLITDVFGNYIIQKLFEYGSPKQRENLANLLRGQILTLSLQMYGCRVIQKALDVIELEQKAELVRELDGHVIKCVRDQNGNHVIQKCIESIPLEKIEFIISSFRGEIASLSMHPYGCRVVQRFLEHCDSGAHAQFIIDEILESVCSLAQDQYGNYVAQHVLERGKPRERSVIIEKLTGSVVQLSQHKFASNVIEKCLEYSDAAARDLLIKEIIGNGDKNDNLLMMMKDQYANYVIQKILQKCSDDEREVLLGLVRSHLTSLKKYTYGKHIVARFELLCGEETQETGQ